MPGAIDWRAPWFGPWRDAGARVAQRHQAGLSVADALNQEEGAAIRFVAQSELPQGEPYERHIFLIGSCPTRDNLHDFFNGLAWLRFPRAKRRLNELQAGELARQGVGPVRGTVRDALTLFDENGALLDAPAPLWEALLAREWRRLFVELRPLWGEARVIVFGHALLEKLVRPRKDLTAHVWCSPAQTVPEEGLDVWLAGQFTPERLRAKPFTPLPLLGIPGWSAGNENFSFYDDSLVFRPARLRSR